MSHIFGRINLEKNGKVSGLSAMKDNTLKKLALFSEKRIMEVKIMEIMWGAKDSSNLYNAQTRLNV